MMSDQRRPNLTALESELDSPTLKLVAKRCPFCGKILPRGDAQFCSSCGKPATSQAVRNELARTPAPATGAHPQKKFTEEPAQGHAQAEPSPRGGTQPPGPAAYGPQHELRVKQKKKLVLTIGSVTCLVLLLSISFFYVSSDSLTPWSLIAQADPAVTLYRVSLQNITRYVGGGGIIFPRQQLDLSFPVDERVISVLVKPGDEVHPKQALIRLDPSQLNAQVTQAANDVAAAQVYLNTVTATGNPVTIAQAQQEYDIAKNKYNALVAETSSPTLQRGSLISPMKGIVTAVNINPGEVITANTPLLTIMDESTVVVHVKIPLSNLEQVHVGQYAIVTPSALPDLNFNGTVKSIIPQADPQTSTFEVWVEVINSGKILMAGMSALVRIQGESTALVVPRLAVLNPEQEAEVFVARDQHAYLQHVQILGRSPDFIYIGGGLSPADMVVLVGLDKLQNGQKIHVTNIEG
jgi:RND family efflux transporter MFP subunit